MNAQEMFEEHGYKVIRNNRGQIVYCTNDQSPTIITFDSPHRYIKVVSYVKETTECFPTLLRPQDIEAAHQQMKELGWIE